MRRSEMASDRSYRQLRNIQDEDISDEETNAFAPLRQSGGGVNTKYRGPRSQQVSGNSCGKGRATCIVFVVLIFVLAIAVVSSFARPRCSREADTTTNIYTTVPQHTQNTPTPTSADYPWGKIRLPTDVKPVEYDIFLHPNLTTYNVTGSVEIQANVVNPPTSLLVLHSRNMTLEDVRVMDSAGEKIPIQTLLYNKKFEQIIIVLKNDIKVASTVKIMIKFTYELQAVLQGFYRSTYKDSGGATKTIATTQFEASDARAAFPCFDEPSLKANFSLKMVRDPDYHTLFNMPLDHTETYGDLQMDVFPKSLKMSTYLVAFVVSEFRNQSYQIRDNLEIGVHAPARQIGEMDLALKILNKTIQFYEKFFGVPYPLPKQDMVAIPDFAAGAMENWGLITYRQVEVLYKPGSTTLRQEQRVSIVIAHELAHQWFGNLVTMKWWNDLWLNEGFASFVEYIGTDNWNKDWHMMDQFILQSTHSAMAIDCLESSHPISVTVNVPEDISSVFDAISYDKGASIIRMLQEYLGTATFLTGLNNYLGEHAYSNAESDDLWKALANQEDGGNVKKMMDTWTLQKGYPVVMMARNSDIIEVSQKQFFLMENFTTEEKNFWVIPLTYVIDNGLNYSVLLQNDDKGTSLTIDKSARWFKGNIGQTGFYRVNYDDENWIALSSQLNMNHKVFDPADRASLIDDANYLARAGLLNYTIALELTGYIAKEVDYVPIVTALGHLGYIGMMLQKTGDYISYKNYMRQLAKTWKSKLGWEESESDPHLTKFLRDSVLTLAIDVGDDDTIKDAMEIFRNWTDNNGTINENLKYPVYCAAARNGLQSDWEFLWNRYLTTEVVSEKNVVMEALACTTDISTIYWYLESMFSGNVRLQDIGGVISSIASQPQGAQPAWQFLKEHWNQFLSKLGSTSFSLANIITSCTASIASPVEYEQAKMFFAAQQNAGSGTRAVNRAIERMDINVKWLQKNQGIVKKWLLN